jgi:hypothetical protein
MGFEEYSYVDCSGNIVRKPASFFLTCRKSNVTPAFHAYNLSHVPSNYYSSNISLFAENKGLCAAVQ